MENNNLWGPNFWDLLHNIAFLYPNNPSMMDVEMYKKFLNSYTVLLPCPICRNHFSINLEKYDINEYVEKGVLYSSSKNGIVLWGIKMHNIVNKMLGKFTNITENQFGIDFIIRKYQSNKVMNFFKNVLNMSLARIPIITPQIENAYADLFYSVVHFLSYQNLDIILTLKRKNISILFNNKSNIQKIISNL